MHLKRKREEADAALSFEDMCCPITKKPMHDPVVASDGYTYERIALREMFLDPDASSPVTGEHLDVYCNLLPNNVLGKVTTSWRQAHPAHKLEAPLIVSSGLFDCICKKTIQVCQPGVEWKERMLGDTPLTITNMIVKYLDAGCSDMEELFWGHEALATLITSGTTSLPLALSTGVTECVSAAVENITDNEVKLRATKTLAFLAPHLHGEGRERADTLLKRAYKDIIAFVPEMLSMMLLHKSNTNFWWDVMCTEADPEAFDGTVKALLHAMSDEQVQEFEDMIISNLPAHKTRTVQALALSVQRPLDRSSAIVARVAPLIRVATLDDDNELKKLALEVLNKMLGL